MTGPHSPDDEGQAAGPSFPTRVLIEAHGIDVRVEGTESAEQLSKLAINLFLRVRQLAPASHPTGFAAGTGVQAERAEQLAPPLDSPTPSPHIT